MPKGRTWSRSCPRRPISTGRWKRPTSGGFYLPFVDFIVADPYKSITEKLTTAFVVGKSNQVGGTITDVVAIANPNFQAGDLDRPTTGCRAWRSSIRAHQRKAAFDHRILNWKIDRVGLGILPLRQGGEGAQDRVPRAPRARCRARNDQRGICDEETFARLRRPRGRPSFHEPGQRVARRRLRRLPWRRRFRRLPAAATTAASTAATRAGLMAAGPSGAAVPMAAARLPCADRRRRRLLA